MFALNCSTSPCESLYACVMSGISWVPNCFNASKRSATFRGCDVVEDAGFVDRRAEVVVGALKVGDVRVGRLERLEVARECFGGGVDRRGAPIGAGHDRLCFAAGVGHRGHLRIGAFDGVGQYVGGLALPGQFVGDLLVGDFR